MDGSRFDDFARTFVTSRRGALRTLLGGAVAGVAAILGRDLAGMAALADEAEGERRNPFSRAGKRCDADHPCGRLAPCQFGICTPTACRIEGVTYQNLRPNPANPCQFCAPTLESWTTWGTLDDRTSCGSGRSCCGGTCCEPTECCSESGTCEECGLHCTIEGVDYDDGEFVPPGGCQYCDAASNPDAWSIARSGVACGDDGDQVCCSGDCCIRNSCCDADDHCTAECDVCTIEGDEVDNQEVNPANACQICDTARRTDGWWPRPERTPCDTPPGGLCCDGVCCNPGECCDVGGACTTVNCDLCRIDGIDYAHDTRNPENDCEICDASRNTIGWTLRLNTLSCDSTPGGTCCDGACLPPDECCAGDGNRESESCTQGCTIDGVDYPNFALNPGNECEHCSTLVSTTAWSAITYTAHCGPTGEQFCSGGGVCCDLGVCPVPFAGVCGDYCDDVCAIDGVLYRHGDPNPADDCQACNNNLDPTAWSPVCSDACCAPLFCVHAGGSHCGPRDD